MQGIGTQGSHHLVLVFNNGSGKEFGNQTPTRFFLVLNAVGAVELDVAVVFKLHGNSLATQRLKIIGWFIEVEVVDTAEYRLDLQHQVGKMTTGQTISGKKRPGGFYRNNQLLAAAAIGPQGKYRALAGGSQLVVDKASFLPGGLVFKEIGLTYRDDLAELLTGKEFQRRGYIRDLRENKRIQPHYIVDRPPVFYAS